MTTAKPHYIKTRVYYPDTDAGGVVYHGQYLNYFDHGRTELLRDINVDMSVMQEEQGLIFVVAKLDIKYAKPGKLDDLFRVETKVISARSRTFEFNQQIILESASLHKERINQVLVEANVSVVCVDTESFKIRTLPKDFRTKLLA